MDTRQPMLIPVCGGWHKNDISIFYSLKTIYKALSKCVISFRQCTFKQSSWWLYRNKEMVAGDQNIFALYF